MLKAKLPGCRKRSRDCRPSKAETMSFGHENEGDLNVISIMVALQTDEANWVWCVRLHHYPRWKLPPGGDKFKCTGLSLRLVARAAEVLPDTRGVNSCANAEASSGLGFRSGGFTAGDRPLRTCR